MPRLPNQMPASFPRVLSALRARCVFLPSRPSGLTSGAVGPHLLNVNRPPVELVRHGVHAIDMLIPSYIPERAGRNLFEDGHVVVSTIFRGRQKPGARGSERGAVVPADVGTGACPARRINTNNTRESRKENENDMGRRDMNTEPPAPQQRMSCSTKHPLHKSGQMWDVRASDIANSSRVRIVFRKPAAGLACSTTETPPERTLSARQTCSRIYK